MSILQTRVHLRHWLFFCFFLGYSNSSLAEREITSGDVYPIILHILEDIRHIRDRSNVLTPIEHVALDLERTPTDVYQQAQRLHRQVQRLHKQMDSAVHVKWSSADPPGRKTPADTLTLVRQIEESLHALKVALKLPHYEFRPKNHPGKTPPENYQLISKAILLLDTLR